MTFHINGVSIERFEPTPEMLEALSGAKVNLSLASPIFSYAITSVDDIFFTEHYETAAAIVHDDVNLIVFNPHFFMDELNGAEERAFVLYHELDHIFFGHVPRMHEKGYEHRLWNEATDYYINLNASGVLWDERRGVRVNNERYQKYMKRPSIGLYDERYLGMSSDDIYDILKENSEEEEKKSGKGKSGKSGKEQSNRGKGFDSIEGNGGSQSQVIKNEQTMQAAAVFSEMTAMRDASNSSGEAFLIDRIKNLRKPKIRWVDKLSNSISERIKSRYTYRKWSTLSSPRGGVIFPSYTGECVKIVFGVDTSGSMRKEDYVEALSELHGILSSFERWEVEYVQCDTTLNVIGRFKSEDDPDNMMEWAKAIFGGYGTMLHPIVRHAESLSDMGEEFNAVIVLTDGHLYGEDIDKMFSEDQSVIVVSTDNDTLQLDGVEVIIMKREKT